MHYNVSTAASFVNLQWPIPIWGYPGQSISNSEAKRSSLKHTLVILSKGDNTPGKNIWGIRQL
jgi:hypothetical protein